MDEKAFSDQLSMSHLPPPDLLIRTSGEYRLSNFMLWQLAYAELYFCEDYWPMFEEQQFEQALVWYAGRERRFGKTSDQLLGAQDA